MFRVKISLPSLTQSGQQYNWMRVSLGLYSEQIIDNAAEIEDVVDKDVMSCEKNDSSI